MFGSPVARAIHERYPPIDLHADTLLWARWFGYDMSRPHVPPFPRAAFAGHVDFARLAQGGIGAQFFGLVSIPFLHHDLAGFIEEQIDIVDRLESAGDGNVRKAGSADDLEACATHGTTGVLLGLEGAHPLRGSLERLEHLARRGVRYVGLAHFTSNEAAVPAFGYGRDDGDGLTSFGRALVRYSQSIGVMVDLAHVNRNGFLEACALATRPVIVSHATTTAIHTHWRHVSDDQLRAVANTGGVVGIMYARGFLGGDGARVVVRHIEHVLNVAGEDTPALGSDWDGCIVPTRDLVDAAHLPLLTDALREAGFHEEKIAKILRLNVMRVMRDCGLPSLGRNGPLRSVGDPGKPEF